MLYFWSATSASRLSRGGITHTYCQHVAGSPVQYRVFRAVHEQRQTMALTTANDDQIAVLLARVTQDLALDIARLHARAVGRQAELARERLDMLAGARDHLIIDLHDRHE